MLLVTIFSIFFKFTFLHKVLQDEDGADGVDEGFVLPLFARQAAVYHRLKGHLGGEALVDALDGDAGVAFAQSGDEGLDVLG